MVRPLSGDRMNEKDTARGFELQGEAMRRELSPAEREELELLKSHARAEFPPEMRERPDPDGPGPLEASRPTLDGGDFLADEKAKDVKRGAQSIGAAVLAFLKRWVGL